MTGAPVPRAVLPGPNALVVLDVGADGALAVERNDDYSSIRALLPGEATEREFPWLGAAGGTTVLSPDGRLLGFTDGLGGVSYAVIIRKTDGSPPVRLGEGYPAALSPDGTRMLAGLFSPVQTALVYPIGAGDTIRLNRGRLEHVAADRWLADGTRVVVCGNEPGKASRCYEQDFVGGPPTPLTPEGFTAGPISPDGRTMVVVGADGTTQVYSLTDRTLRAAAGVTRDDSVRAWARYGRALLVAVPHAFGARIDRVDPLTGARTMIRDLTPRIGSVCSVWAASA